MPRSPRPRPARVHRLLVRYPEGSLEPGWAPEGWEHPIPELAERGVAFAWPRRTDYLTRAAAETRAEQLRGYGAEVEVISSSPVRWPLRDDSAGCHECGTLLPCNVHYTGPR